ncbi:MAG: LptF/LptG family permease, partial [Thermodesulfobacteriota bacterium]
MTLYRYILKEMLPTFLASLLVFVFIMVAAQMLSITELIVTRGVHFSQVAGIVLFLLPDILAFALPAVTLMSVVVAFLRLSVDSEIIALKSSGISLYQMLP